MHPPTQQVYEHDTSEMMVCRSIPRAENVLVPCDRRKDTNRLNILRVYAARQFRVLARVGHMLASMVAVYHGNTPLVMPGPPGVCATNIARCPT